MLAESTITAFVPITKVEHSKLFYVDTLGLKLISQDDYALELAGRESILRLTIVNKFEPQAFAVLGFKVKDLVATVESLMKKGVNFEKYDSLNQDDLGIWISPSKAKVAWFKDPDENLLSLTQYP